MKKNKFVWWDKLVKKTMRNEKGEKIIVIKETTVAEAIKPDKLIGSVGGIPVNITISAEERAMQQKCLHLHWMIFSPEPTAQISQSIEKVCQECGSREVVTREQISAYSDYLSYRRLQVRSTLPHTIH